MSLVHADREASGSADSIPSSIKSLALGLHVSSRGRIQMRMIGLLLCGFSALSAAQSQQPPSTRTHTAEKLESQYLTMTIVPGWTVTPRVDQIARITHGKYVLTINPIFTHASGGICGRFPELGGERSIEAVMAKVDQPAGGFECARSSPATIVNKDISLTNLYTDRSKSENGCTFPASGQPVWFGSAFCGQGSESEYAITLGYDTDNVNELPRKNSAELKKVFADAVTMLKTLDLKPPILISKISPDSARVGTTVTVYGSGFNVPGFTTALVFNDFPNNPMPPPVIADDGKSLTFQTPNSIGTVSCQSGRVLIGGFCLPIPADHVNINDCPQKSDDSSNFCGIPLAPGTYKISVWAEGSGVESNAVSLLVLPTPTAVAITLLYPNSFVKAGDTITIRGEGFTPTANTVRIGSVEVNNIPSPDGKTISFQAPIPSGDSFDYGNRVYQASVSNANGESTSISIDYRTSR